MQRDSRGEISLNLVEVLPTLAMRDRSGVTLGWPDAVTVLPIINGEIPYFITTEYIRAWGKEAYEHVMNIVGESWIKSTNSNN